MKRLQSLAYKFLGLLGLIIALIWMTIIFSEYWKYNPNYSKAIALFQYYDLVLILLGIGCTFTWLIKKSGKYKIKKLNGISIFLSFLMLDVIAFNLYIAKDPRFCFTWNGLVSHLSHIAIVALCLTLIYFFLRVLGIVTSSTFSTQIIKKDLLIIQVAIGIMIFTAFLFLLGSFGLLNSYVLISSCIVFLSIYYKISLRVVRETIISPIKIPKDLNAIGVFSFLFLTIFLILNFVEILRPIPLGADSLRIYVNLPNLIAKYGGLVEGHQPYNWSLFMSTGLLLFGRIDVVLSLSFFGGILSLLALFRLSNKWLDINYSLLILLIFYSLPMINFLSYLDMKVDMGLLFYSLCVMILFHNWANPIIEQQKKTSLLSGSKEENISKNLIPSIIKENRLVVLIGLMLGFSLGIKLTSLFLIIATFSAIWFYKGNMLTYLSSFFLSFSAIFMLQLDAKPALRQFHQNVDSLQWILLVIGMGLFIYAYLSDKRKTLNLFTYSIILAAFTLLPILPWLIKNASEVDHISMSSLLNGKTAKPTLTFGDNNQSNTQEANIIPGYYSLPGIEKDQPEEEKSTNKKEELEEINKPTESDTSKIDLDSKDLDESTKNNTKIDTLKNDLKSKNNPAETENKNQEIKDTVKQNKIPKVDKKPSKRSIKKSSVSEDLHRFMGYDILPIRYLSLPYDVIIKTNMKTIFVDVGFLLLILFPFLFLYSTQSRKRLNTIFANTIFLGLAIILLLISIPSAYLNLNNLIKPLEGLQFLNPPSDLPGKISYNITNFSLIKYDNLYSLLQSDSSIIETITYPLLLILFLLIIILVSVRIQKHDKVTQSIVFLLLTYFFIWWILGSGVPWYGMILFCVSPIFFFKSISPKTDDKVIISNWSKSLFSIKKGTFLFVSVVWVFMAFTYRATNYNPSDKETATQLFTPAQLKFTIGELDQESLINTYYSSARNIAKFVNEDEDEESLIYMVGSQCGYFIDNNDQRVFSDTFLDSFDKLIKQFKTKAKIIDHLKSEGFKYIIFDLKMDAYDVTPEKTLTKKFFQFQNTLYNNPKVQWLATDRKIKLESTGEEIFGVFPDEGSILKYGTVAIFIIK